MCLGKLLIISRLETKKIINDHKKQATKWGFSSPKAMERSEMATWMVLAQRNKFVTASHLRDSK